jgi:hypothetical protein
MGVVAIHRSSEIGSLFVATRVWRFARLRVHPFSLRLRARSERTIDRWAWDSPQSKRCFGLAAGTGGATSGGMPMPTARVVRRPNPATPNFEPRCDRAGGGPPLRQTLNLHPEFIEQSPALWWDALDVGCWVLDVGSRGLARRPWCNGGNCGAAAPMLDVAAQPPR